MSQPNEEHLSIAIKISTSFFVCVGTDKLILKCMWKCKGSRLAQKQFEEEKGGDP